MEDYKEIKVWGCNNFDPFHLYLWRGELLDNMRKSGCSGHELNEVQEVVIKATEAQRKLLLSGALSAVYRAHFISDTYDWECPLEYSDWYVVEEDARSVFQTRFDKGVAEGANPVFDVSSAELVLIKPVHPKKITVLLQKDSKGRLYTNISSKPEWDGLTAKGKCFFPDRSWTDAVEGWAKVKIVHEKDTYGFIKGTCYPDRAPTLDEVLDWCWDNTAPTDDLYQAPLDDGTTRYIVSVRRSNGRFDQCELYVNGLTGKVHYRLLDNDAWLKFLCLSKMKHEFLLLHYGAEAWGLTTKQVSSRFEGFIESHFWEGYKSNARLQLREDWLPDTYNTLPKSLLGKAVEKGCIHTITIAGFKDIQVYTLDMDDAGGLFDFTPDEFEQIKKEFSEANQAADKLIRTKAQHGKIRTFSRRW